MKPGILGLLEMSLVFGLVVLFAVTELVSLRRAKMRARMQRANNDAGGGVDPEKKSNVGESAQ